ncbi:3-hydroxyisobutyrate dehydrogenase [Primorskyibacter flagellatus]|uniref:3-hydroxyisobutyrate dehydrogenase n=1 Tax=Primorskyibacter flagellatus TaxID=1387277 RepID=A0A917A780_9RHOB|nr:NAD(P)-dependent oxidoreductase [Primorskyibacter flagellatus]GGE27972.1 3-hydroxyisobutyrate dehydrogenase [Primorskyibacter flagellatus]
MSGQPVLGFIGLGVMGEPICRNMMVKSGAPMLVSDLSAAPVARLTALSAEQAAPEEIAARADMIFLSLPGGPQVEAVAGTLIPMLRAGQVLVDMSTAPVGLTRDLAARAEAAGARYADAPVARTRAAAEAGTLAIMVGAEEETFSQVEPVLSHAGDTILHCGPVGCGQVAKILNNMVLFQNVVAMSEALALGTAAGMDGGRLFDIISQGSGDSFALRNHGMKAMIPDTFPKQAFPTDYALKDVSYALELARDAGLAAPGAELAEARMRMAKAAGFAEEYFPVLARLAGKPTE